MPEYLVEFEYITRVGFYVVKTLFTKIKMNFSQPKMYLGLNYLKFFALIEIEL